MTGSYIAAAEPSRDPTLNRTHFVGVSPEPYALASGSGQMRTDALPEASAYGSQSECH